MLSTIPDTQRPCVTAPTVCGVDVTMGGGSSEIALPRPERDGGLFEGTHSHPMAQGLEQAARIQFSLYFTYHNIQDENSFTLTP